MLINDNDYSCHITAVEIVQPIVWGSYHAISHHITPIVINSLGSRHKHTHTRTHTHTWTSIPMICTGSILRNQVHAGCRPARTWFKNIFYNKTYSVKKGDNVVAPIYKTGYHLIPHHVMSLNMLLSLLHSNAFLCYEHLFMYCWKVCRF